MGAKTMTKLMATMKRVKFRTKTAKMGEKIIIIIPKSYHREVKDLEDQYIDVEIIGPQ